MSDNKPGLLDNIKGIIFDFDGTLYDNVFIAFNMVFVWPPNMFFLLMERIVRKRFTGRDYSSPQEYSKVFFSALGKACFQPPQKVQAWYYDRFIPRFTQVLKRHYKPRRGLKELFEHYTAGKTSLPKIAVYSDYPFLKERMEALGIPTEKVLMYGPESFGAQKPAARPFLRIAEELGALPQDILVIGDRVNTDGIGALNAGMKFFRVKKKNWDYVIKELSR